MKLNKSLFAFYKSELSPRDKALGFCATFFGAGLFPVAPGTVGSFVAILLWLILGLHKASMSVQWMACLALFALSVFVCQAIHLEDASQSKAEDASQIVIDEAVGMWIALSAVSFEHMSEYVLWCLLAFSMFRAFDIVKPFPCDWIDKNVKHPVGIILDDVMAGIYAFIMIHIVMQIFQVWS